MNSSIKSTKMSLVEILKYLHELSENDMSESDSFYTALDMYTRDLIQVTDKIQIKKAIDFLAEGILFKTLVVGVLIEQLEEKL